MLRVFLFAMAALTIAACDPGRSTYNTAFVEPVQRTQLFTMDLGSRPGLICGQALATYSPPDTVAFGDLASDDARIGYQSGAWPPDVRRRCRRDRNIEHHAELWFDIAPYAFARGGGPLVKATVSGTAIADPGNTCTRGPTVPLAAVGIGRLRPAPEAAVTTPLPIAPDFAEPARDFSIDGTVIPYRDRALELAAGDTTGRSGNFVHALSAREVATLNDALSTPGGPPTGTTAWLQVTLIGAANPQWRKKRTCMELLENVRLTLVFRRR